MEPLVFSLPHQIASYCTPQMMQVVSFIKHIHVCAYKKPHQFSLLSRSHISQVWIWEQDQMWSFNIKISTNWNTVPSVDSSKSQDRKALTVKPIVTQLTFCSSTFIMGILTYEQGIGLSGYIQLTVYLPLQVWLQLGQWHKKQDLTKQKRYTVVSCKFTPTFATLALVQSTRGTYTRDVTFSLPITPSLPVPL